MTQSRVSAGPHHRLHQMVLPGQDSLCTVPLGLPWFEVIAPSLLIQPGQLSIVIYPNESLLAWHANIIYKMGFSEEQVATLSSAKSPQGIRKIWELVERQKVSLLMMPAFRFQHIQSLSNLLRHPNLGPIVIEQSHLALPYPMGVAVEHSYHHLPEVFQQQWSRRPPILLMSAPIAQRQRETLAGMFHLQEPYIWTEEPELGKIRMAVERCLTAHQKVLNLISFLRHGELSWTAPSVSLVLYEKANQGEELAKRLRLYDINPLHFHRRLRAEEKAQVIGQAAQMEETVILVEQSQLSELMLYNWPHRSMQLILWEIPHHTSDLMLNTLIATPPAMEWLDVLLLYCKEDYVAKRNAIKKGVALRRLLALEELARLRDFYLHPKGCRMRLFQNGLYGWAPHRQDCYQCDFCQAPPASSLWRNIVDAFLY